MFGTMRRKKICMGFYCVGIVTSLVLLTLYSVVYLENEIGRIRKNTIVRKRYMPLKVNLPTTMIYKQGSLEIVKKEQNTIFYKNTIEEDILSLSWVNELREILVKNNNSNPFLRPHISLVVADGKCIKLLLNWLIVAMVRLSDPLHNVVVLGLDEEVCEMLKPRGITCVFSDPDSFMRTGYVNRFVKFLPVYTAPQTRLMVARLVNYWGYSFASYDTDALVIRNPQVLYDAYSDADIVAGAAMHWPEWATQLWGFSMCLGAFMMRSGEATEELWKTVSRSWGEWGSEQDQFNRALANTIFWNHTAPNMTSSQFCRHGYAWQGLSRKIPRLQVLLLPQSQFCRGECCDDSTKNKLSNNEPFVLHGGGGNIGRFAGKINHMKDRGVWFLSDDWRERSRVTVETGKRWLRELSTL